MEGFTSFNTAGPYSFICSVLANNLSGGNNKKMQRCHGTRIEKKI
jgi:hypothetical protein